MILVSQSTISGFVCECVVVVFFYRKAMQAGFARIYNDKE